MAGTVGLCDGDDALWRLELIKPTRKIEGIAAAVSGATAFTCGPKTVTGERCFACKRSMLMPSSTGPTRQAGPR